MTLKQTEIEILHLIAQGYESKEISELTHYSKHTVMTMRQRMMFKLGVKNAANLVSWGYLNGVLKIAA